MGALDGLVPTVISYLCYIFIYYINLYIKLGHLPRAGKTVGVAGTCWEPLAQMGR